MPSKVNRFAANSTWIEAIASDAGEVYIGPDEPTDPSVELWYDTDEPDIPVVIPPWNPVVYQNGWRDFDSGLGGGRLPQDRRHRVPRAVSSRLAPRPASSSRCRSVVGLFAPSSSLVTWQTLLMPVSMYGPTAPSSIR